MTDKKTCPHCKEQIHVKAKRCPHCQGKIRGNFWRTFGIIALVLFGLIALLESGDPAEQQAARPSNESNDLVETSEPDHLLPEQENTFINAIQAGIEAAENSNTELQRGAALSQRDNLICSLLPPGKRISEWIGTVAHIGANSDGHGILEIEIANKITVATWNNAISDVMHETLIDPSSPIFPIAASLQKGDMVKFAGEFFTDHETCLHTQNLGLRGKISQPTFVFRFSALTPLNT